MERKKIIQTVLGLVIVAILGIGGYYRSSYIRHPACAGETMGTTYSIRISGKVGKKQLNALTRKIEARLHAINAAMSTWDEDSEISRFNHSPSTDPLPVSEELARVVEQALDFSRATGGAFDPTLQPLLNLWGFGSEGEMSGIPPDKDILAAKAKTGWQNIAVIPPSSLSKRLPGISLDLGAIAKGYGVDVLAELLESEGYQNWFVEIGGEVVVSGVNPGGEPWRIGIQYPSLLPESGQLKGIVHLTKGAVATSGDYRNYIEEEGRIYSHILDPRTGRAVRSDTAGVSVYAPSCTAADAVATALFVMGHEDGLAWVEQMQDVEAMFLIRGPDESIIDRFSSGFIHAAGYSPIDGSGDQ